MTPALRTRALSLSLAALCGLTALAVAEEQVPAPVPGASDATRRAALAEAAYVQGRAHLTAGRLDEALRSLTMAVDAQPENETYAKALQQARATAGVIRDPRSLAVDRAVDELAVRQQQLWIEAQSRLEEGRKALTAGDHAQAERLLQQAAIRLETLPYADPRREPELRSVETLLNEARSRRTAQEQTQAAQRNRDALDEQQRLRDMSLKIERDRIDAMLARAQRARERRDYDEAILLTEQILKINRAEDRATSLLAKCRRERHAYLRQVTADRWDEEHRLLTEGIRSAMLPQIEILKYSADWPEIDARRRAKPRNGGGGEETSAWQKEIRNQLEQEVTLDFQDNDLADVIALLQNITNANIVLDPQVLAANPPPPPVTLKVEKMKLGFALDFIMKLTSLTYTMRDEAIYVSNKDGVRGDVYMVPYDIRDLTHDRQGFPGPSLDIPEPGGKGASLLPPIESEAKQETSEFIDIIKKVIEPATWEGEKAIKGVDIGEYNGMMIVTHTGDVHRQVDELLRALRNQKGTQIHVKCKFLSIENSELERIGVDWTNFTGPSPIPGQVPINSPLSSGAAAAPLGAYYGSQANNIAVAGRTNTGALTGSYAGALRNPDPGEGLKLQGQTWRLAENFYASAILEAVQKHKKGNVIYEPDLTMFNGQQAHIVNLNQQSYIADYDVVQNQYDPVVSVLSYGTVLDVVAIASADKKYITLTLRPSNAQVESWRRFGPALAEGAFPGGPVQQSGTSIGSSAGTTVTTGGDENVSVIAIDFSLPSENPMLIPELRYESSQTSVTIPDGGSLVIAGMTNSSSGREHQGIPFLSHIPFLGRLFSTNARQESLQKQILVVQADVVLFEEIEKNL